MRKEFNCDIVDMEGAAIALMSYQYGAECLMIKCVSDSITGDFNEFLTNFYSASEEAVKILDGVFKEMNSVINKSQSKNC
ncbi:phosphorylase family protein [Treponema phagedenis]|uniref:phosphorylase family protein n=1 Tax=Treponema phagedenis TaxID=162 RepID=UPI0021CCCA97|nr:hypothetical protein [Treponema phagedenis]